MIRKLIRLIFPGLNGQGSVKNFGERQKSEQAYEYHKRGAMAVSLSKIVGSVRRYNDFDENFRLKEYLPRERLDSILEAMRQGKPLPPVELYQIKEEYYVLDGNHRVAAAKQLGFKEINARIVECLPQKKSWENVLYMEKRDFYAHAPDDGIDIEITEAGQYPFLLEQISYHREHLSRQTGMDVPFPEAFRDWYNTIYRPFVNIIRDGNLLRFFPTRTVGDLYSYLSYQQWGNWWDQDEGKSIDDFIFTNMEAFRENMKNKEYTPYEDMQREITAFILMNVETRKEKNIMDKLFAIDAVQEVHSVHGNIDIIVKVVLKRNLVSSDAEVLTDFVQRYIRSIPGIASTHTLVPGMSKVKQGSV